VRAYLILALKAAVTLGLLGWLATEVDLREVRARLGAIGIPGAVAATLVLATLIPATAARWGVVQHAIAAPLALATLLRLSLVGLFFNQVLPAPVGGDAMRIWGANRAGLPLGKATSGVLLERLWGLVTLVLFAAPVWPWLLPEAAPRLGLAAASSFAAVVGLAGVLVLLRLAPTTIARRLPGPLRAILDDARATAWPPGRVLAVILWSLAGHVASMAAMATLAAAMGLAIAPLAIVVVVPIALLAAVVPASFAGWGVREGALVTALAGFGVPAADALSLSVAFGLVVLMLALPGAVLWMTGARRDGG